MQSEHLLGWIVIGLVAGYLAARLVEGRGLGCVMNVVVGLTGAIIGGVLVDHFSADDRVGFLGSIVVSFIGACLFLGILRLLGVGGRSSPLGVARPRGRRW